VPATVVSSIPSSLSSPFAPGTVARSDLEVFPSAAGELVQIMPRRLQQQHTLWYQRVCAQLDNFEQDHFPGISLGAPPQELKFSPNFRTKCKSLDNEAVRDWQADVNPCWVLGVCGCVCCVCGCACFGGVWGGGR